MSMVLAGNRIRTHSRKTRRTPTTVWVASVVLGIIVVLGLIGPWIYPHSPTATNLLATNAPPSMNHPFGTDAVGRDILARILSGARISLLSPLVVTLMATFVGTIIAVSSAWFRGRVDSVIGLIVDISLAFPSILLAILVAAFAGPGVKAAVISIGIAYIPYQARIIRSTALAERSLPYIEALQQQGFHGFTICARHLVPNIFGMLAALCTLTYGYAMVDLAAISFLGLGVQPPQADWGSMVAEGLPGIMAGSPQESLAAGAFIVVSVIAVNIVGEALADRATGRTS